VAQKVALYSRLSKEDKEKLNKGDDSESIQNQVLMLKQYARRNEWSIHDVYKDEDISGAGEYRPEFERLLRDAEQKKFDIVLCKTQDRFTRDMEVVERIIHKDLKRWGIRFVGAVDGADTDRKENKKARQINGLINEWYLENLSENIRSTFKAKMKAGQYIGSFAPYGYMKNPKNKYELIEDKEAADVVRMIFNLYLQGFGTHKIAQILTKKGIPKPSEYKKNNGSNLKLPNLKEFALWGHTTINRILRNEVYIGTLIQGKETTESYKDRTRVNIRESEWEKVKNTHKGIIKEENFYKVQEDLNKKRRVQKKEGKAHIFANKLRCRECGGTMLRTTTNSRNGKRHDMAYAYFKCKNSSLGGNLICEHKTRISYTALYDHVYDEFLEIIEEYEKNSSAVERTHSKIKIKITDYTAELNKLVSGLQIIETDIKDKERVVTNLYTDRSNGTISEDMFSRIYNNLVEEIEQLENRKNNIIDTIEQIKKLKENKADVKKISSKFLKMKKKELTRDIVVEMIDYIDIGAVGLVEEADDKDIDRIIDIYWDI